MASATYEIAIDIGRNNTYAHAQSNVTAYVMGDIKWTNGLRKWDDEFGQPQRMTFTLDNSTGIFDPERAAATYYNLILRGMLVRLRATFSATTYTLFIGKIDKLTYENSVYEKRTVTVSVRDLLPDLLEAEYTPTLLQDVRTDEAIQAIFDAGVFVFPYAGNYWILDSTTNSILDTSTTLADFSSSVTLDQGQTTLTFVGDTLGGERGTSVQTSLRQIVAAECGGRFWYDTRTGSFTFHNRHRDINPTIDATLTDDDFEQWVYLSQEDVLNQVIVRYQPKSIGAPETVVWQQEDVISVDGNETRVINTTYRTTSAEPAKVSVIDGIQPINGTDYVINTAEDGTGTAVTDGVTVNVEFKAARAVISITNSLGSRVYFTQLQVRGTPLYTYDPENAEVIDADSLATYDLSAKTIDIPALSDAVLAQSYAGYLVSVNRTPSTRINQISFTANKTSTQMTRALSFTIGDAITINAARVGHNSNYIIVGEQHSVRTGGEHTHMVTWILKPAAKNRVWILDTVGFSELGTTTLLTF